MSQNNSAYTTVDRVWNIASSLTQLYNPPLIRPNDTRPLAVKLLEDAVVKDLLTRYYNHTHTPEYAADPRAANLVTLAADERTGGKDGAIPATIPRVRFISVNHTKSRADAEVWLLDNLVARAEYFVSVHNRAGLGAQHVSMGMMDGKVVGVHQNMVELVEWFHEDISPENFEHSYFAALLELKPVEVAGGYHEAEQ